MKRTVLGTCFTILALYALAYAPSVQAYQFYDNGAGNGCVQCHTGFQGGNQSGPLHFAHFFELGVTECNVCHPSGPGSKPVETYWSGPGGGLGCVGCHGRDYGETSPNSGLPKATGYGLRQHHANNGVFNCQGCHSAGSLGHPNPLPVILDENVQPPYYGTAVTSLVNPCFSPQEDMATDADLLGLDNDGDGAPDYPADLDCPATTTTSTTTTTTLPFACGASPALGCEDPTKGILMVNEKKAGKEKLKVVLKKLKSAVTQGQFGDPVFSETDVAVCVYDDAGTLSGEFLVERAVAELCGTPPKWCWTAISDKGYKYGDKDAAADGILKMTLKGGNAGKGAVVVIGKNNPKKGQTSLPTGIAPLLLNNTQATVQVLTSDASCFGITTTDVKKADGTSFKASGVQ